MALFVGATFHESARFGTGPVVANSARIASGGRMVAKRTHTMAECQSRAPDESEAMDKVR